MPPAAVAFALRAVHEPALRGEIATLGRLTRRQPAGAGRAAVGREGAVQGAAREPGHAAALDFETRKARALLRLAS